jgi:hypothetical protein
LLSCYILLKSLNAETSKQFCLRQTLPLDVLGLSGKHTQDKGSTSTFYSYTVLYQLVF